MRRAQATGRAGGGRRARRTLTATRARAGAPRPLPAPVDTDSGWDTATRRAVVTPRAGLPPRSQLRLELRQEQRRREAAEAALEALAARGALARTACAASEGSGGEHARALLDRVAANWEASLAAARVSAGASARAVAAAEEASRWEDRVTLLEQRLEWLQDVRASMRWHRSHVPAAAAAPQSVQAKWCTTIATVLAAVVSGGALAALLGGRFDTQGLVRPLPDEVPWEVPDEAADTAAVVAAAAAAAAAVAAAGADGADSVPRSEPEPEPEPASVPVVEEERPFVQMRV